MRLRHQDWEKLFTAVSYLHSDIDPGTLEKRTVSAANHLLSGEITAFDFFTDDGVHTGKFWSDPLDAIPESEYAVFVQLAHEHPFVPSVFRDKTPGAIKTTDVLTPTQFKRTALYNEFYGPLSIHNQLLTALPVDGLIVTCAINRTARDFTEEERTMFDLISPHMANAIRNSGKIKGLFSAETGLSTALETKSTGVISLNRDLRIEYISRHGRSLIEFYFGTKSLAGDLLPDTLDSWVKQNELSKIGGKFIPPSNLKIETNKSTLTISLMFDEMRNERFLILEEARKASPADFQSLGLTERQSEVLFWLTCGKTDKDISVLMEISPRTVQKHLESVFVRLGVETRTAAVAIAANFQK